MNYINQKISQIRKSLHDKGLDDVRLLVLFGVGFIALSVFWNGAKIVQQNYELALKVQHIQQENEILELQNRNKELQNEYLKTDEFAELTARRVFGKAAPGERLYIVPQEVALNALSTPELKEESPLIAVKPTWQRNLEAWINIYLGS